MAILKKSHDLSKTMKLTIHDLKSLLVIEQISTNQESYNLKVSGSNASINEINNWPSEHRQDISLMIGIAQYLVRGPGGAIANHALTIPNYKIYVKTLKQLICIVKKDSIIWQPGTENLQTRFNNGGRK